MPAPGDKANVEVYREVATCAQQAIAANRQVARAYLALLVFLAVSGISLILYGVLAGVWIGLPPGVALTAFVYWPLRRIDSLRRQNIALELYARVIPLADSGIGKRLAQKWAEELLRQMRGLP